MRFKCGHNNERNKMLEVIKFRLTSENSYHGSVRNKRITYKIKHNV
jgi:hypothetical protein